MSGGLGADNCKSLHLDSRVGSVTTVDEYKSVLVHPRLLGEASAAEKEVICAGGFFGIFSWSLLLSLFGCDMWARRSDGYDRPFFRCARNKYLKQKKKKNGATVLGRSREESGPALGSFMPNS